LRNGDHLLGIMLGARVWFYLISFGIGGGDRIDLLLATGALLLPVGVAACGVPVRRALRIEPMGRKEVKRAEAGPGVLHAPSVRRCGPKEVWASSLCPPS